VANTLTLSNVNNNINGNIRLDSGTLRVANGGALGTGQDSQALRFNSGTLECAPRPPRASRPTTSVSGTTTPTSSWIAASAAPVWHGDRHGGVPGYASASGNRHLQNLNMAAVAAGR